MRRAILISAAVVLAIPAVGTPGAAQRGVLGSVRRAAQGAAVGSFAIGLDKEREIGRGVAATVAGRWHVVNDAALNDYVNSVGTVVAQQSPRFTELPFRFAVLDTDEINAFATPGGYVFVTRGALELMESEAELAGVLAHEVAHVDRKHVLEQLRKQNMLQGAQSEADLNGFLLDQAVGRLTSVIFTGLGRGDELESDSIGMIYAAASGYRPDGLVTFVRKLQQNETNPRRGRFLAEMKATHPAASERVTALERQAAAAHLDPGSGQLLADRFRRFVRRR
ncbi:M48 family metalloprotease [Longimicrobium sp.]|uniref:M48 family metalloprotease n=1 Tax=Longimicrobium sp. TaxID=2029185 RepID=UPI002CD5BE09|nr:M48 family metalloprotease [Longimicrobium sp.]HSU15743.1 M48 family metalloprotease [Longimicrobium sp.]